MSLGKASAFPTGLAGCQSLVMWSPLWTYVLDLTLGGFGLGSRFGFGSLGGLGARGGFTFGSGLGFCGFGCNALG